MFIPRICLTVLLAAGLLAAPALAESDNAFTNALGELLAEAEGAVSDGELELAESHYRVALLEDQECSRRHFELFRQALEQAFAAGSDH